MANAPGKIVAVGDQPSIATPVIRPVQPEQVSTRGHRILVNNSERVELRMVDAIRQRDIEAVGELDSPTSGKASPSSEVLRLPVEVVLVDGVVGVGVVGCVAGFDGVDGEESADTGVVWAGAHSDIVP